MSCTGQKTICIQNKFSRNTYISFPFDFTHMCGSSKLSCYFWIILKVEISNDFYQAGCFLLRPTQVNNDNNSKVNGQGCRPRKLMLSECVGGVSSTLKGKLTMHIVPH